ncbi:uncharacterized protein Bfra_012473 [Botrytis fragariae]|uniref:Uncharacterized protein n=1 Tax=Botrytis fragariae TaxID=1964551 RepID=A0A8H6AGJ0_9HELO|nr:uncharacterized protein Bfra_012473 [Botrytis fragariae]KAF5867758.1 hypothetical protein Bfra_012473 [Botrytis fragariae]
MPSKCPKCDHSTCRCCKTCKHRPSTCTCKPKKSPSEGRGSDSDKSKTSSKSKTSGKSADTTDSQKTRQSGVSELTGLTNTISEDLNLSVESLQVLVENETINKRENYIFTNTDKKKWSSTMRREYDTYHQLGAERIQGKRDFDRWYKDKCRNNPTEENDRELQKRAIKWAEKALSEMEGRVQFMANYRQAYEGIQGYERHLIEAQNVANSARNAITHARQAKDNFTRLRASSSAA